MYYRYNRNRTVTLKDGSKMSRSRWEEMWEDGIQIPIKGGGTPYDDYDDFVPGLVMPDDYDI